MWILLRKLEIFVTPKILYNNNIDNNWWLLRTFCTLGAHKSGIIFSPERQGIIHVKE